MSLARASSLLVALAGAAAAAAQAPPTVGDAFSFLANVTSYTPGQPSGCARRRAGGLRDVDLVAWAARRPERAVQLVL